MLNELLVVERGARKAGVELIARHPDIQATAKRISTLAVRLDDNGRVFRVTPVPPDAELWTLRNHNKNSFPFIQVKPLLDDSGVNNWQTWSEEHRRPQPHVVRVKLIELAKTVELRRKELGEWANRSVMGALRRRLEQLTVLDESEAAVLPAALRRFLLACDPEQGGDPTKLLESVRAFVLTGLMSAATDAWIRCSTTLLVEGKGALWIDADGEWSHNLADKRILGQVSRALTSSEPPGDAVTRKCGLSGRRALLVRDTFPRADLPAVGPTILFSRFEGDPPKERYGRFGSDSMPVSEDLARSLAAASIALTAPERKGITWRAIPGETPKQIDLLLAFVEAVPEAPAAGALADEEEDDYSEETPEAASGVSESIAAFEKRTERLIEAVRGKVTGDFRQTPVHITVIRRVDSANRKVVYTGTPTVGQLYGAVTAWAAGEKNVPAGLTMPVLRKGERSPGSMAPPHVAPLGVISFSRQLFVRQGSERQEVPGMPAAEALGLFLEPSDAPGTPGQRRATHVLRLVLTRRAALVSGAAHAQRCKGNRKNDSLKDFDGREVLRTITVLGLLLHKLGRPKEVYMSDAAFKLGQLLAAADMVHAGYCADVRGGDVPPSLLGNQVFTMAQAAPAKALATLCRRWKPYDGWAKKAARERKRAEQLVTSKNADERQRGWDIRKALRHAREIGRLAEELGPGLADCRVNDTFRAELLLGYMAGLPKAQRDGTGDDTQTADDRGQED